MSLLYPEFLWALLLNIFPVIIHLFNLQRHEILYFSDLTLLKSVEKETKRTSQIKNIILMLLRILMISSIVFAFCFPYNKKDSLSDKSDNSIIGIYIDNSCSMLRMSETQTILEKAKDDVMKLIGNQNKNTKYVLTTNEKYSNKSYPITQDQLIKEIPKIERSSYSLNINEILAIQKEQANNQFLSSFWFTDLQKKDFDLNQTELDTSISVNLIHYLSNNTSNISIDSVWFSEKSRKVNTEDKLNVKISNYSDNEIEFQTKLLINESEVITQGLNIIEGLDSKIIEFNFIVNSPGYKNCKLEISDSPFNDQNFDDHYYFTYSIDEDYKVLHLKEHEGNIEQPLKILFESIEKTKFESLNIKDGFTADDLDADLIIVDGITSFKSGLIDGLINNENRDENIVYIPNNQIKDNKSNPIINSFNIQLLSNDSNKKYMDENKIDPSFFKSVFGKKENNLNLPFFKNNYKTRTSNSCVNLLSFQNDDPLLIKNEMNGDQLYLFSCPLNSSNSNLINHALFVPIFLKIKENCSKDFIRQYEINNIPEISMNGINQQNGQVTVDNNLELPTYSFFPVILTKQGNSYVNCQNQIKNDGHYYIKENDSLINSFSTNLSRSESNMSFFSTVEFSNILANSPNKQMFNYWDSSLTETKNKFHKNPNEDQYWIYFVMMALIFIALEITLIKLTT